MNKLDNIFRAFAILTFLSLFACQSTPDGSASAQQNAAGAIAGNKVLWHDWGKQAFAKAADDNKLVFLYLTAPWCGPCAEMERDSYSNDKVAGFLNNDFVSVRVDGDRLPNVADRYSLGGFPSCVILTPDLKVVGGAMRAETDSLALLLERVSDAWQHTPVVVQIQAAKLDSLFRKAVADYRPQRPSDELLNYTERAVYHNYDSTYGGFGNQPKFPLTDMNAFIFGVTAPNGALVFKGEIIQTLAAQTKLLDPAWGGFYRSAAFADWSGASHEKLLANNAKTLSNYVDAYLIANDSTYRSVAEKIITYLDTFLRAPIGWGFYNSQAGFIIRDNAILDRKTYFAGDDIQRREQGIPSVAPDIFTAPNCYAVSAYLSAGRSLERKDLVQYALNTLDSISTISVGKNALARHDVLNPGPEDIPLLEDQVALTSALLDAYETTGDPKYLLSAENIAQATFDNFQDPASGGLSIDIPAKNALGRMAVSLKPYALNSAAVVNFVRLYYHTADEKYKLPAEKVFLYLMGVPIRNNDLRLCLLANAYLRVSRFPTKLALIGPRGNDYDSLLNAVFSKHYPRLSVAHLGNGSAAENYGALAFQPTSRAQLFVCGDDTLSRPIESPDSVPAVIREFQIILMSKRKM
ncbi:MAG: DUF255 domain-containing protein [Candidatus Zixiibacteriota bacterium]